MPQAHKPAAFMLQMVGKYQSRLPSVQALSGISASLNDAIGTLTEAIFEVAEKGGVSEELVKELVIPQLLEIDGIYRRMEEACASADGESGEVLGAIGPIKSGIGKGLVLAQQFLEYSKMQEIRRETGHIDLAALVKAVIGEVAASLEAAGISCESQIEGEDFKLRGDCGQLESVVKNLVLNAKDALQDSAVKKRTLRLSRIENNGVLCIRLMVADTGTGIPAEAREKIFQPFYTTKPATGTGLGLSVVKRIVEAYDGEIDFESRPGGGTEFLVEINV